MVLNKPKIVLICDSNDNYLLSFIYDEIKKKKTRLIHGVGLTLST